VSVPHFFEFFKIFMPHVTFVVGHVSI